ncbi:rhodanese-like domain-containing protein [Candidatus Woesearchaeota archaeon]|nr:MAG: rhodanese-like domain-containing protein [Candidatus Woesearchaeota archaeon]
MGSYRHTLFVALQHSGAILALAVIIGLLVNQIRPDGLSFSNGLSTDSAQTSESQSGLTISIEEAKALFLAQAVLFIDTRSMDSYKEGHIQGAKNLPYGRFDEMHEKVLKNVDNDCFIITYCSGGGCRSSEHVAFALLDKGYPNTYVLNNGWTQWQEHNMPIETEL